MVSIEDLISSSDSTPKPSILEALLSTVDTIFTNNRMLQKSRLTARHIRGVSRVVGSQTFLRARFEKEPIPFINSETGEFTTSKYDNRVLTSIADSIITGRISLDGKSRDEIIRIFQAVGGSQESQNLEKSSVLGRFDY